MFVINFTSVEITVGVKYSDRCNHFRKQSYTNASPVLSGEKNMTAAASPASNPPAQLPMTRREFLYYIWAASMALFMAETGGAILWFAYPRFRVGEFG